MQHPFEGVMAAGQEMTGATSTRRALLGRMLGALAGLFGLTPAASAQGRARGPTTLALGEEGGRVTTFALGEEGGRVTTFALGEEGGWRSSRRWATTYALGEEGGWMMPAVPANPPLPLPELPPLPPVPGFPTTTALGEEGG
jgi:hypothetical protein